MRLAITLACVFFPLSAHAQSEVRTINSNWSDMTSTDAFTDQTRGIVLTQSDGWQMIIKCDDPGPGSVYVHISTSQYLGESRNGDRQFTYRFDSQPAVEDRWSYDGRDAMNFNPYRFLDEMREADTLAVRLINYRFESYDHRFAVAGAAEAIDRVLVACNDTGPHAEK